MVEQEASSPDDVARTASERTSSDSPASSIANNEGHAPVPSQLRRKYRWKVKAEKKPTQPSSRTFARAHFISRYQEYNGGFLEDLSETSCQPDPFAVATPNIYFTSITNIFTAYSAFSLLEDSETFGMKFKEKLENIFS